MRIGRSREMARGSRGPDILFPHPGTRPSNAGPGHLLNFRLAAAGTARGVLFRSRASAEKTPGRLEGTNLDIRNQTSDPIQVFRIRHMAPYNNLGPCFERLFRWAVAIGVPTGRVLTFSWDDSERVPADRLRCDAYVELRTKEEPPPGIELGNVGGGRYAVYRIGRPYEGISEAYRWLLGEWLSGSGELIDDGPCMENS